MHGLRMGCNHGLHGRHDLDPPCKYSSTTLSCLTLRHSRHRVGRFLPRACKEPRRGTPRSADSVEGLVELDVAAHDDRDGSEGRRFVAAEAVGVHVSAGREDKVGLAVPARPLVRVQWLHIAQVANISTRTHTVIAKHENQNTTEFENNRRDRVSATRPSVQQSRVSMEFNCG
jgi:hypothetical protein